MSDKTHHVQSHPDSPHKVTISLRSVGLVALVVILCGLSFLGGSQYQKHHEGSSNNTIGRGNFAGGGRFGGGARRDDGIGSVTAISSSSITINDQRSGSSKTYNITSATQITDNGSTVDYADIKTGDMVLIATDSSTSTTATRILVNPSFGGGPSGAGQQSNSTQSQ